MLRSLRAPVSRPLSLSSRPCISCGETEAWSNHLLMETSLRIRASLGQTHSPLICSRKNPRLGILGCLSAASILKSLLFRTLYIYIQGKDGGYLLVACLSWWPSYPPQTTSRRKHSLGPGFQKVTLKADWYHVFGQKVMTVLATVDRKRRPKMTRG